MTTIKIALFLIGIGLVTQFAYAENYTYTLHESEKQDELTTQICMNLTINSPQCDMVYGGISSSVSDGKLN